MVSSPLSHFQFLSVQRSLNLAVVRNNCYLFHFTLQLYYVLLEICTEVYKSLPSGTSLTTQWLRRCLPMQRVWVQSLVEEPRFHMIHQHKTNIYIYIKYRYFQLCMVHVAVDVITVKQNAEFQLEVGEKASLVAQW